MAAPAPPPSLPRVNDLQRGAIRGDNSESKRGHQIEHAECIPGPDQRPALPAQREPGHGQASTPVITSPQPAEVGNGPASRPSAARRRKNPPATRQTFRPIMNGIGIPSSEARTDGEIDAATAVATSGSAIIVRSSAAPPDLFRGTDLR